MTLKCPSCTTPFVPQPRKLNLCPSCLIDRETEEAAKAAKRREMKVTSVRCLMCRKPFERVRDGVVFCGDRKQGCTHKRKQEADRVYSAAVRARKKAQAAADARVQSEALQARGNWLADAAEMRAEYDELVAELTGCEHSPEIVAQAAAEASATAWVPLTPPKGHKSPWGPKGGFSTYDKELQGMFGDLRRKAAGEGDEDDPGSREAATWWRENPHWAYELDTPLADLLAKGIDIAAAGAVCAGVRGTYAGYKRHIRAEDKPCADCAKARREARKSLGARALAA